MRILVAEDNALNLELITDLLELEGHVVEGAPDGLQALDLARRSQPDLILMDLRLPRMDGLTATRRLKQDPATRAIPIIALSANAMAEDHQRALEAGCLGHLTKPIDTEHLMDQIRELLTRQPGTKEAA